MPVGPEVCAQLLNLTGLFTTVSVSRILKPVVNIFNAL